MAKKIIGICGSPKKKDSTTMYSLEKALEACREEGFETEIISLSDNKFYGCSDCGYCRDKVDCSQKDDFTTNILPVLNDDSIAGIIFASPVYFGGVTGQMKTLMDRSVLFRRNGFMWEKLVAGALTVGRSRNGGQELAAMDIVKNCLIQGMTVVPDASPTSHFGGNLWSGKPEGIEQDKIGIQTAVNLGKRVGMTAKKLNA